MSGSSQLSSGGTRRRRMHAVRLVAGSVLVAVLAVEVILLAPSVRTAIHRLGHVSWWWVGAAIGAQLLSMSAFGRLQRTLLTAAGVTVRQVDSTAVVYAANAMAVSLPGGPLFSTTFTFRQTRRWGASRVVASWQLAMSGVLATATLALIGVVGGILVGTRTNYLGLAVAIGTTVALIVGLRFLVTHPAVLLTSAGGVLRWVNAARGQPAAHGMDRIEEVLEQLEAVQLRKSELARASWWALANWIADVACLGFACLAAGAHPSIGGLLIAFTAGKVVATVPLLPGGLGVVDGTLTAALVASGLAASAALPAVIVFRLISFPMLAALGWLVFLVRFRAADDADTDSDAPD